MINSLNYRWIGASPTYNQWQGTRLADGDGTSWALNSGTCWISQRYVTSVSSYLMFCDLACSCQFRSRYLQLFVPSPSLSMQAPSEVDLQETELRPNTKRDFNLQIQRVKSLVKVWDLPSRTTYRLGLNSERYAAGRWREKTPMEVCKYLQDLEQMNTKEPCHFMHVGLFPKMQSKLSPGNPKRFQDHKEDFRGTLVQEQKCARTLRSPVLIPLGCRIQVSHNSVAQKVWHSIQHFQL